MRVAYVTLDLTHLRYFIPFSRRLHQFMPDVKQSFFLSRNSDKYNGLSSESNFLACQDRITRYCPYAQFTNGTEYFDMIIQVEVGERLNGGKRISIQHGFDYAYKTKELSEQVDVYICSSNLTAADATSKGVTGCVVSPVPVCLWDIELERLPVAPEKSATIFYPDMGDNSLAATVADELIDSGFSVFVKQRKKHQPIACRGEQIYDLIWYPSEALILPLTTDITVGFGSSAYTDLVPAGVSYVNVDIHSNSSPWNVFIHPQAENYIRILDEDRVRDTIRDTIKHASRIKKHEINVEQLYNFMLQLMR